MLKNKFRLLKKPGDFIVVYNYPSYTVRNHLIKYLNKTGNSKLKYIIKNVQDYIIVFVTYHPDYIVVEPNHVELHKFEPVNNITFTIPF